MISSTPNGNHAHVTPAANAVAGNEVHSASTEPAVISVESPPI